MKLIIPIKTDINKTKDNLLKSRIAMTKECMNVYTKKTGENIDKLELDAGSVPETREYHSSYDTIVNINGNAAGMIIQTNEQDLLVKLELINA